MKFIKNNLSVLAVIIIGSLVWSLTMVKSGFIYPFGMGFWGPNGHDGVWHIALINRLAKGSIDNPTFAGSTLQNYHIGFDLFLALLHRIFSIQTHILYFQVMPVIFAILIGTLTYWFVFLWRNSKIQAIWSTFFVYFGGSFGWFVTLVKERVISGESIFWSQQSISTLVNPPFAMSLIFLLGGLIFLIEYLKNRSKIYFLGSILSFSILGQIKIYGGILVLGGLLLIAFFQLIKEKKLDVFWIFISTLTLSILLFIPLNRNASSLIVFQPFWFLETMMGFPDRIGWNKFYEAMVTYRMGHSWFKFLLTYSFAFLVFLIGNSGLRIVGILGILSKIKKRSDDIIGIFLITVFLGGIGASMLFLQKGTAWNTIQFFYYSLFALSIFAGSTVSKFLGSRVTVFLLIFLTVPSVYSTLGHYLPSVPPAKISLEELQALDFLKNLPEGIVLTQPFDRQAANPAVLKAPRPLYLYESTAYVSAFSGKVTFMEDEINLSITGYNWENRKREVINFFNFKDFSNDRRFLEEKNISYIYLVDFHNDNFDENKIGVSKIFQNGQVVIYKVD